MMGGRYDDWFPEAFDMHWTCKCTARVLNNVPYCARCGELRPVPKPEKPTDKPRME